MANYDYLIYCEGSYNKGKDIGSWAYVVVNCKTWKTMEKVASVIRSTSMRVFFQSLEEAMKEMPTGAKVKVISDADCLTKVMSGAWIARTNIDLIAIIKDTIRAKELSVVYEWKSAKQNDPVMLRCWKICRDKLKEGYSKW